MPALFLLVAVIGIVLAVLPDVLQTPHILGDAVSTVFYFSNWYSIHGGVTYFSLSSQPSPLLHTWSLAIEEQFYLVWPLVVLAVLKLRRTGRRHSPSHRQAGRCRCSGVAVVLVGAAASSGDPEWTRRRRLHVLFAVACLGSLASAILMAFLAPNGYTTRAYYGTDTRAQALLVGAAIAIGLTLWRDGSMRRWFTRSASVLAVAGIAGTAALWCTTSETSTFAFSGGFLVASLLAGAVVLGCAVAPRSLAVRLLELPPLPQWGRISYGVYLWYWPVLLVVTGQRLHWGVYPLFLARVGITVAIAAISYDLVEMPIRRGALRRWRSWIAAPVGAAAAISAVFVSTLVPVGATELQGSQLKVVAPTTTTTVATAAATSPTPGATADPTTTTTTVPSYLTPSPPATPGSTPKPVKVLLVGDSVAGTLGVGLAQEARPYDVQIANEGTPGCSLSMQTQIKVLFYTVSPGRSLRRAQRPQLVAAHLAHLGRRLQPRRRRLRRPWRDLRPGGSVASGRTRAKAPSTVISRTASVRRCPSSVRRAPVWSWPRRRITTAGPRPPGLPGPRTTLRGCRSTTTPCGRSPTRHRRAADGSHVYVFDLNGLVSPGGKYSSTVGSVNVRCADGVHFTRSGGIFVG